MSTKKWPDEIELPDEVGKLRYFKEGSPCCAIGHAIVQLGVSEGKRGRQIYYWSKDNPRLLKFRAMYKKAAKVLFPWAISYHEVEGANDYIFDPSERRDIWLVVMCLLGYTEGMPKRILKKAERVKAEK